MTTKVGDIRKGEGVYGFRRAFVIAGAESLIMGLWKVANAITRGLIGDGVITGICNQVKGELMLFAKSTSY